MPLTAAEEPIARELLKEIQSRLGFLLDVGLGYLTLDRSAATLSGGESQRIRLASQMGSELTGVVYILDEPSIGLHQRDNGKLLATLKRLRDLGNSVIVVEHDEETMEEADWIVDFGPGAGELGGRIVAQGTPAEVMANPDSLTGAYLCGREAIDVPRHAARAGQGQAGGRGREGEQPQERRRWSSRSGLFIAVTGVSGAGKSTLVNEILYPALAQRLYETRVVPGKHKAHQGRRASRQGHRHRPAAHRPDAAEQPGDVHQGVRRDPRGLRPDAGGAGLRLRGRAASASTSRAAAASRARATG